MMSTARALILSMGFTIGLALCAGSAVAKKPEASRQMAFDIPAQELRDALNDFGRQAGLSIAFYDDAVANHAARALAGSFTPEAALALLLRNSNLYYEFVNERTVAIRAADATHQGDPRASTEAAAIRMRRSGASSEDMQLTLSESTAGSTKTRLAAHSSGEESAERTTSSTDQAQTRQGVPEMLVRGARTSNADIRRTEDDVQPYVIFDREEIESSMASDLETFLKARLPMNQLYNSESQADVLSTRGGQSSINLRGLGSDETLVLVNGRRMPGVASELEFFQPDINGIPLSSVERIEILPSTAGGIYGGGATGGVVNIILKRDYRGVELTATYDNTMDGGGARRRVEGNAGFALEGGRTHIMLSASYQNSNPLLVGDRDFHVGARELLLKNYPDVINDPAFPIPDGYTTNIKSASGNDLVLVQSGQSLGSPVAFVPIGYAGPQSDGGAAFLGTAGSYNLDLPDAIRNGSRNSLLSNPTVRSASANLRREFTDRIEAFADLAYYDNHSSSRYARDISSQRLAVGPNNPFTESIRIIVPLSNLDYGTDVTSKSKTHQIAGGLIFRLPRDWTMQPEYAWSRSSSGGVYSANQVTSQGRAALANGELNVLRDVNAFPLDFSPYYFTPVPNLIGDYNMVLKNATLRLAGPVWTLPGGAVVLSTVMENRQQMTRESVSTSYSVPDMPTYRYHPPVGSTTDAIYIETTAPLISAANARRGVQGLDLQLSYRYDSTTVRHREYDDTSVTVGSPSGPFEDTPVHRRTDRDNQYTFGFRYRPIKGLALRASYGEGVLSPSVLQLAPRELNVPGILRIITSDPKRDGEALSSWQSYTTVGSFDLVPEQSRSWSAGMIFTPEFLSGFRLSLDYTLIKKTNEIGTVSYQTILDLEDFGFSNRITRAELTPEDQAMGHTVGPVLQIDSGSVNIARSEVEAYDIQADYTWETAFGTFAANFIASYQPHLKQQVLPTSLQNELVGFAGGPLKWRANGGVTWNRGPWTAGWNMQYYDSYFVYGATNSAGARDRQAFNQGSPTIPTQSYHDVFARYRFDDGFPFAQGLLANSEILVSVQNVLNDSPPIVASFDVVTYSFYGDPRMRRYSISFKKRFE